MLDIKDYLQSMGVGTKTLGIDNPGYGSLELVTNPVDDPDKELRDNLDSQRESKKKWISMFDVKMILIGSTAMMFSKIAGI